MAVPKFMAPLLAEPGVKLISKFVDPTPYLAASTLTLNPQVAIRGSALKVAESLLSGRCCVSTIDGARGLHQQRAWVGWLLAQRSSPRWPVPIIALREGCRSAATRSNVPNPPRSNR